MREHHLTYTGSEYHLRFGIFLTRFRFVREHNSASPSFTVTLNHLSCLTPSEFRAMHQRARPHSSHPLSRRSAAPPDSWDWRDKNVVVSPSDQGQCGSAWAIQPTNAQASQWAIVTGSLTPLSVWNIIDCDSSSAGCDGGLPESVYQFVIAQQDGHFMSAADYPSSGGSKGCLYDPTKAITKLVSYGTAGASGDEAALQQTVYERGPGVIAIDASHTSFQLYSGGVYSEPACSQSALDHYMGVVGYGVDGATPYWILENSWGVAWGEKGFMRIIRNANNMCGVASYSIFPVDQ
jgi:C1A family cysteine protease